MYDAGVICAGLAMKGIVLFIMIAFAGAAQASDGSGLIKTFLRLSGNVRVAMIHANSLAEMAATKRAMYGPSAGGEVSYQPVSDAISRARSAGGAAYQEWVRGKSTEDKDAAKKLTAAFMTYIQNMEGCPPCDREDQRLDDEAMAAYDKAVSDFRVETGTF